VIIFCLVLGLLIEILQGFVPTRGGSFTDIAPNILGILIGYVTSTVLKFKTNV
jgi:VanZ family protein